MATLMRHRRGIAETEDYYDDDDDGGSGTAPDDTTTATEEAEEEEEDHRLHLGLHSMTAKGIQHLCSELLEMEESSEQDLRANVYFSYLSFIRIADDLDKDVHRLKHQVIAHRRLIQHLSSNHRLLYPYYSNSSPSSSSIGPVPAACFTEDDDAGGEEEEMGVRSRRWELELDVLVSEHRMEQALEMLLLLLLQGQALLDDEQQLLLQKKKAMVAERLASVAGNPRTPRPELLRALSGLCKLGESERANHLLFNWYSASVASASSKAQESIKDLARLVLSSIVGASRSFVALHHGQHHPSSSPQLLRWAREEMLEDYFSVAFSEYVRSSSMSLLGPALEAAQYLLRSPLLRSLLGIELVGLMAPCIRDALAMYQDRHLKEVVRLMVASDTWELGRFLISPPLPPHHAHSYSSCLLTSSGRKFLTLVHEFVHDVACPMLNLGILDDDGASLLVAELFREYMNSILELELMVIVPSRSRSMTMSSSNRQEEAAAGAEMEILDDGDEQQQQYGYIISVLINCSTLVSLFPAIRTWTSSPPPGPSLQVINEAAGHVWDCFCQHLIRDTIMSLSESQGAAAAQPQQEGSSMMMPSLAFQVVFHQMRRLEDAAAYSFILSGGDGEDGTMKKLLRELMEAIISWLSTNLLLEMEMEMGSWILHGARQAQLDIHFLIEIARLVGGDLDITVRASALDLLRKAQDKLQGASPSRSEETSGWAADAAKHAVQVLLDKHNSMTIGFGSSSASAAEESESDDDVDGSAAPTSSAAAVEEQVDTPAKSSDEFISIEFEEDDDEEKKLNAPSSDDSYNARQVDDGICDDGENPLLAAAPEKGSRRKKKAAVTVSTSSRPRWH